MLRTHHLALVGLTAALTSNLASAATVGEIGVNVSRGDNVVFNADQVRNNSAVKSMGGDVVNVTGQWNVENDYSIDWDVTYDPDPFIDAVLNLTNNQATTQTFSISLNLPIFPAVTPDGFEFGDLSITGTDDSGDGSLLIDNFVWEGILDGNTGTPSYTPFSVAGGMLSCGGGTDCSLNITTIPSTGPTELIGFPVNSTMGIEISFDLSAGDTITIDTRYEIQAVPVPAALPLLVSALAGMTITSRRRARHA